MQPQLSQIQIRSDLRPGDPGRVTALHGRLYAAELPASAHLYRAAGFRLTEEHSHDEWGAPVTEQRFDLRLRD